MKRSWRIQDDEVDAAIRAVVNHPGRPRVLAVDWARGRDHTVYATPFGPMVVVSRSVEDASDYMRRLCQRMEATDGANPVE